MTALVRIGRLQRLPVRAAAGSLWTLARARRTHRRAARQWAAGRHADAVVAAEEAVRLLECAGSPVDEALRPSARAGSPVGEALRPSARAGSPADEALRPSARAGSPGEAAAWLLERAGLPAELTAARITLGDLQFQLGRHAAAVETFRAAGALLPLGNCLRVLGRYAEAEAALTAAPADPATRNALGVLCKDTGRYAEAAAHYAAALADPDLHGVVHHNLAGLAHARGRHDEALIAALTALVWHARERGCGSPEVAADAAVLGAIQLGLGRLDEAVASLRRARDIWQGHYGRDHYEARLCRRALAAVERVRQAA